jgi:PAS domain S-box-containing protein
MKGSEARDTIEKRNFFDRSLWEHADNPGDALAKTVGEVLQCDEVCVVFSDLRGGTKGWYGTPEARTSAIDPDTFTIRDGSIMYRNFKCPLSLVVHDIQRARLPGDLALTLTARDVRSFGLFPIKRDKTLLGFIACYFKRGFHRWKSEEIEAFVELSDLLSQPKVTSRSAQAANQGAAFRSQYQRLASHGNIVIITTDNEFRVTDVFGNTEALLGVTPAAMRGGPDVWSRILDPRDVPHLTRRIMRLRKDRTELREEVRVVHGRTGQLRWIMLRALPQFSADGVFLGWEGFGVDVTDRRDAQDRLLGQNRRLEALFEIARALHGIGDAAAVTFKGLRAVARATQSDCGYACFFDRESGVVEVVAALGLSEKYLDGMAPILNGPSILRDAIEKGEQFLIDDIQVEPRAARDLAKSEGVKATIVMPMSTENQVHGAMVLFKREAYGYQDEDFELVSAAAAQIALAIRQAEMFEIQKRQSESLRSLYKVSRELAKYRSSVDFAEHVFPVLQDEFALKRGWLGTVNEQGTFLLGKADFGAERGGAAQDVQIEITQSQKLLYKAFLSQRPLVVSQPEAHADEPIAGVLEGAGSLVLVPMVAIGQVTGVLVLEPLSRTLFRSPERIRLLVSMANEMATAMMAGRFENKMSEALRMRMAGLLASGVAHNFNNLLQAILGQVSLIEMQTPKGSPILDSSQTITEAAKRGASLVSQLLNFATNPSALKAPTSIADLVRGSRDLYQSLVGKRILFAIEAAGDDAATVLIDTAQIQQVITNMLVNAKEAVDSNSEGRITIAVRGVTVRTGELPPDVSPGPFIRVDIMDNGVGMTPEQQARCFEPFFTTKNIDQGTGVGLSGSGLGLSAAYSIVRQHDGVITVHSTPRLGSTFSVYLPVFSTQRLLGDSATPRNGAKREARGVLLLGMESGVQPFVSSVLESLGYASRGVFDLRQTSDVLNREQGRWGVVMVDADGLGSQAVAVCTQLLADFTELRIVCVGSNIGGRAGSSMENLKVPRVQFVEKPLSVWSVEAALHKLVRGERAEIDQVATTAIESRVAGAIPTEAV